MPVVTGCPPAAFPRISAIMHSLDHLVGRHGLDRPGIESSETGVLQQPVDLLPERRLTVIALRDRPVGGVVTMVHEGFDVCFATDRTSAIGSPLCQGGHVADVGVCSRGVW